MKKLGVPLKEGFLLFFGGIAWKIITYKLDEQERNWHKRSF